MIYKGFFVPSSYMANGFARKLPTILVKSRNEISYQVHPLSNSTLDVLC